MANSKIQNFEDFVKVHSILLAASGIPNSLHFQLFRKLSSDTFDAGNYFQIEPCLSGLQRRLVFTSDFMEKDSNLFLVDHAWTFRLSHAPKQLQEVPGLVERMASMMCVDGHLECEEEEEESGLIRKLEPEEILEAEILNAKEKGNCVVRWIELEDVDLDDDRLLSLDLHSKFPDLYALSLRGNKLKNAQCIVQLVTKFKSLRALWLNDNPVLQEDKVGLEDAIIHGCPQLEILNSQFTNNYGDWALGFCGDIYDKENPGTDCSGDQSFEGMTSLDLSGRGIHNLIQKLLPTKMPNLSFLNLRENLLDQNSCHELRNLLSDFDKLHSIEVDIPGPLGENAWEILESLPNVCMLNGVNASKIVESKRLAVDTMLQPRLPNWTDDDSLLVRVLNAMWLYLMTYRLANDEKLDETSVWYMMDELGSALRHSDAPNFRVTPFLYMPEGNLESAVSFSIIWPIQNIYKGDECTRDFLYGIGEDKQRSARLTAWFHTPQNYFMQEYQKYWHKLQSKLPFMSEKSDPVKSLTQYNERPFRVYTDIPQVEEFLTRPEFSMSETLALE